MLYLQCASLMLDTTSPPQGWPDSRLRCRERPLVALSMSASRWPLSSLRCRERPYQEATVGRQASCQCVHRLVLRCKVWPIYGMCVSLGTYGRCIRQLTRRQYWQHSLFTIYGFCAYMGIKSTQLNTSWLKMYTANVSLDILLLMANYLKIIWLWQGESIVKLKQRSLQWARESGVVASLMAKCCISVSEMEKAIKIAQIQKRPNNISTNKFATKQRDQ